MSRHNYSNYIFMKKHQILRFIFPLFLIFILTSCGASGKDPGELLRMSGLKIDDYEIIYQEDNLERESSAWDDFKYALEIKDNREELKNQLDKLVKNNQNWTFENDQYVFHEEDEDNYSLSIYVNPYNSELSMEYCKYNIFS